VTPRRFAAGLLLVLAFLLAYLPDIGHGFIRDDFRWVQAGELSSPGDVVRIFGENTGFYRPVVTLSFGVDRALFGLNPFPYALTNVAILFGCAVLIARLGRELGFAAPAAAAASAVWAFNLHGVNMAVLWLSGRTALLLCLFALLATIASLRRAWWLAGLWCLAALLSKEEAVTLPLVLLGWFWYSHQPRPAAAALVRAAVPLAVALGIYAVLRWHSGAFGPASAPDYYQFTFQPSAIGRNVLEYADRSCTFAALVIIVAVLIAGRLPNVREGDGGADTFAAFAVLWIVAGFAVTVFLPLRSSLYALCPSIGSALVAGSLLQRLQCTPAARMQKVAVLLLLPVLLLPLYRTRNRRWVTPADASAGFVADLQALKPLIPPGAHIVALDAADERLSGAFEGLFPDAVALFVHPDVTGEIVTTLQSDRADAASPIVQLRVGPDGHLAKP
jgi:hypothetical protein